MSSQCHLLQRLSSFQHMFLVSVRDQVTEHVHRCLCILLYSGLLIHKSAVVPTMLLSSSYLCSITWSEVLCYLLLCSCCPQLFLQFWNFFLFHVNFRIIFSSFVRNAIGILIRTALNLWISFEVWPLWQYWFCISRNKRYLFSDVLFYFFFCSAVGFVVKVFNKLGYFLKI